MLRAAKRIDISEKTFQSYNGLMLAPTINLHGLVITADQTIDPQIKEFI